MARIKYYNHKTGTWEYADTQNANGGNAVDYDQNVKSVNHRGYNTVAPENTIPAFILSKKNGFKYVECDVSFTSDGVPVLLHDSTIDRTSDGSGSIASMTYAQAAQYDYGSWKSSAYAGTHLPTLDEFLLTCKGLGLHPYIEIKSSGMTQANVESIVSYVKAAGMKGKVTYISFNATYLGYVKTADPSARLGFVVNSVTDSVVSTATGLKTDANEVFVDAKHANLTDNAVALCISADMPLEVWTVNTVSEIENVNPYISGVSSDSLIAGKVLYNKYSEYTAPDSPDVPVEPDEPDVPEVPDEPEKTLSSISATYSGGDVSVGTAVTALTGIVVTAYYSDGSTESVTGYTLSGTIAEGSNTVTVMYQDKTTTFTVNGVSVQTSDKSWDGDNTVVLYSDDISYGVALNPGAVSDVKTNNKRASYTGVDISMQYGYKYKFDWVTTAPASQIGVNIMNETALANFNNGLAMGTSNRSDPGWQDNGCVIEPPELINGSPTAFMRLTFRMDTSDPAVVEGFIQKITITRTAV